MTPYQQRAYDQGKAWINGRSEHNIIDDECCPDFSCCNPDLYVTDRAERMRAFNQWAKRNSFPITLDS